MTTEPIPPGTDTPSASEVLDLYWKSWPAARARALTMRDIMKPVLIRRLPAEARAWLMYRFERVL